MVCLARVSRFYAIYRDSLHKQTQAIQTQFVFPVSSSTTVFAELFQVKRHIKLLHYFIVLMRSLQCKYERLALQANLSNLFLCNIYFSRDFRWISTKHPLLGKQFHLKQKCQCAENTWRSSWWFETIKSNCHWMAWITSKCVLSINSIRLELAIAIIFICKKKKWKSLEHNKMVNFFLVVYFFLQRTRFACVKWLWYRLCRRTGCTAKKMQHGKGIGFGAK